MKISTTFVMILLNLYFIEGTFLGKNGIIEHKKLKIERESLLSQIKKTNNNFASSYYNLTLLDKEMINLDFLDEIVRSKLNYSNKDELVVTYKSEWLNLIDTKTNP
jgi:cell division protein FtsB